MASTIHAPVYPPPPAPSYAQHGHSASMNGSFSQPPMASFDGSQSVASTPAPTPPPPRPSSQQQMMYGMNGGPHPSGALQRNSFGSAYPDPPGYPPPPYYTNNLKPQIYTVRYTRASLTISDHMLTYHRLSTQTYQYTRWRSTA